MTEKKTQVSAVKCLNYNINELQTKIKTAIELSGGLPSHIKSGAKVLLNPNLLTAVEPETGVTTHPEIVRAVIKVLKTKGITDITLGDSPAGSHSWDKLWSKTGMKKVAEEENVNLIPFSEFKTICIQDQAALIKIPVLKSIDEYDAIISLPKLKTHLLTKMTGAVKNSYGLVIGGAKSNFHGKYPSPVKMSNFLARLYGSLKPDYVIMDAIEIMEGDGPNYGTVKHLGAIVTGRDAVAVDSCVCGVYGYNYKDINILAKAVEFGFGIAQENKLERTGDAWHSINSAKAKRSKADILFKIPEKLFLPVTFFVKCRPVIDKNKCIGCGLCSEACSQNAINITEKKSKLKASKCVLCMCCIEACPYHAIELSSNSFWRKLFLPGR